LSHAERSPAAASAAASAAAARDGERSRIGVIAFSCRSGIIAQSRAIAPAEAQSTGGIKYISGERVAAYHARPVRAEARAEQERRRHGIAR
jgi:hypothetical protein